MPMPIRPLLISVLLTASLLGFPAHAQQTYFGGNLALLDHELAEVSALKVSTIGLYGKMGFSDERGILRGELRLGVIDGKENVTQAITLEASGTLIGAYALVGMPAESAVRPYAFLGYSLTDWTDTLCLESSFRRECEDADDRVNDISFGFGVDFDLSNDWIINVEYGFYVDDSGAFEGDGLELSGLSVGISVPFDGS